MTEPDQAEYLKRLDVMASALAEIEERAAKTRKARDLQVIRAVEAGATLDAIAKAAGMSRDQAVIEFGDMGALAPTDLIGEPVSPDSPLAEHDDESDSTVAASSVSDMPRLHKSLVDEFITPHERDESDSVIVPYSVGDLARLDNLLMGSVATPHERDDESDSTAIVYVVHADGLPGVRFTGKQVEPPRRFTTSYTPSALSGHLFSFKTKDRSNRVVVHTGDLTVNQWILEWFGADTRDALAIDDEAMVDD